MNEENKPFEEIEIAVEWEIDDGYAGKSRPQHFNYKPSLYFDEEEWNEMDDLDKEEAIEEEMQIEFEKKVRPIMNSYTD